MLFEILVCFFHDLIDRLSRIFFSGRVRRGFVCRRDLSVDICLVGLYGLGLSRSFRLDGFDNCFLSGSSFNDRRLDYFFDHFLNGSYDRSFFDLVSLLLFLYDRCFSFLLSVSDLTCGDAFVTKTI